ncbi:MAG: response regulator [Candidatus Gygaella obscura]|nr:response regulator [Candidatus Gygaella obscura]
MDKIKVLVIDDEKDFLKIIGSRIKKWGYDLIIAEDAASGLKSFQENNPDIVILDYLMPNKNGLELLKKIRNLNKDIPAIMFTAYPNTELMSETQKLNISAFIPKMSVYSDTQISLKSSLELITKNLRKQV